MRRLAATGMVALICCAGGAASAAGVQYACANGDVTRAVEVQEPGSAGLACEVIYRKPNEGEPEKSIWRAASDVGFCRDKAVELIALLSASGWTCAETPTGPIDEPAAGAADAPAPVDESALMKPSIDDDMPDIPLAAADE